MVFPRRCPSAALVAGWAVMLVAVVLAMFVAVVAVVVAVRPARLRDQAVCWWAGCLARVAVVRVLDHKMDGGRGNVVIMKIDQIALKQQPGRGNTLCSVFQYGIFGIVGTWTVKWRSGVDGGNGMCFVLNGKLCSGR